jgi:hypothetical protein
VASLAPLGASSTSEGLRVFVLTPTERRILLEAASHPSRPRASFEEPGDDTRELGRTLVRMERKGLLERGFSGHIITGTGQVVAAALRTDG